MFPAKLQSLSEVYSCKTGLFRRKYRLNDCSIVYFSELKCLREQFESTTFICTQTEVTPNSALKPENNIYSKIQLMSQKIQIVYFTQTNRLIMFRKTVVVYAEKLFHSFVHLVVCFTTGPQPLPKGVLHTGISSVSFNFQYPIAVYFVFLVLPPSLLFFLLCFLQ